MSIVPCTIQCQACQSHIQAVSHMTTEPCNHPFTQPNPPADQTIKQTSSRLSERALAG